MASCQLCIKSITGQALRTEHFEDIGGWEISQSHEFREKGIPLPESFQPSPGTDAHLAVIDRDKQMAWDIRNLYILLLRGLMETFPMAYLRDP